MLPHTHSSTVSCITVNVSGSLLFYKNGNVKNCSCRLDLISSACEPLPSLLLVFGSVFWDERERALCLFFSQRLKRKKKKRSARMMLQPFWLLLLWFWIKIIEDGWSLNRAVLRASFPHFCHCFHPFRCHRHTCKLYSTRPAAIDWFQCP